MGIRRFITDEYDEKIDEYVSTHSEVDRTLAERAFVENCTKLEETLKDDAPVAVVRRLAFHQLEWHPPAEDETYRADETDE